MNIKSPQKMLSMLLGSRASGAYLLLFAIAVGAATFVENDFGTSAAQKIVYRSTWFSALLTLFGGSILYNIIKFRMIQQRKWSLFAFHFSIIIILIGAGVTRYFGYEGVMHIRENGESNQFLSSETYLKFEVSKNAKRYKFDEPVFFASLGTNRFDESYQIGSDILEVRVKEIVPNPEEKLVSSAQGVPMLKIVMGGTSGREEYILKFGDRKKIQNLAFNFGETPFPNAVNILLKEGMPFIQANQEMSQMVMATQQKTTLNPAEGPHALQLRSLYTLGFARFVFSEFVQSGTYAIQSKDRKIKRESTVAVKLEVQNGTDKQEVWVYGQKGLPGRQATVNFENLSLRIAYGSKPVILPFFIRLHDFQMERYPGTDNAASYASEVTLIDPREGLEMDYRIYMNHILNYDGYRFFQSSFDRDEKGTYLSVNHDWWGSIISYIGYFGLTIGMVLTLFSKTSRFQKVLRQLKEIRAASVIILALLLPTLSQAQTIIDESKAQNVIAKEHADRFSRVVVQDHRGRMKPIHTLSREILRKVSRKESLSGLSADQVCLGMFSNKQDWLHVPIVKNGKHSVLHNLLGSSETRLKYSDFFNKDGSYKLREVVSKAYSMEQVDRGTFEKEVLKLDERVNILNMVFRGSIFRLIPVAGDPNNTWIAPQSHGRRSSKTQEVSDRFFISYKKALREATLSGNYTQANKLLSELTDYQVKNGGDVRPSASKIELEIWLNKLNVFNRLSMTYAILGIIFLLILFIGIFKPNVPLQAFFRFFLILLIIAFAFHILGLGLRWYVSGRAPWSNGYESMIYIAWTTVLAGVLFVRKSAGGLAATMTLSATILLVALLSHMDPEITPLVPVLKSYWLTIHVSLEAGSYGFLMLGAVIGIINLILFMTLTSDNKDRVLRQIRELTLLSEITLIGGVIMISTGTYLGGIWANESWGRYWGWDAKETWALVTILVYAFILHMRIIPKLYSLYAYNLATVFGLASVIMTYYGVNYYLSGLHSYAAGDPVPVPSWVYVVVSIIALISLTAFWKRLKFKIIK
ncbi:MAG: cytochrome c biogenesis protein CcsA [Cyclobacteriaceae bacterium]